MTGLAAQKSSRVHAVVNQNGQQQLHGQHHQNRNQPRQQRNASLLHGDGGEVCKEHCDDKFHRLHFAELALSHEADDENEDAVENDGADE